MATRVGSEAVIDDGGPARQMPDGASVALRTDYLFVRNSASALVTPSARVMVTL